MDKSKDFTHLDAELRTVKDAMVEMMNQVLGQINRSEEALLGLDPNLADEILRVEKRVNAMELTVDKEIENALALYQPVAIDLRFLMATFKINSDVERMGDHAEGIAHYILRVQVKPSLDDLKNLGVNEMFEIVRSMLEDVFVAYETEDADLARKVFKMDKRINEINTDAAKIIHEFISRDISQTVDFLYMLSIVRKLERCGDLAKNIAEEIIFYLEAKVLKHKKKKSFPKGES